MRSLCTLCAYSLYAIYVMVYGHRTSVCGSMEVVRLSILHCGRWENNDIVIFVRLVYLLSKAFAAGVWPMLSSAAVFFLGTFIWFYWIC